MAQTATVKRDARMGEAEARMEAGIRVGTKSSKEKNFLCRQMANKKKLLYMNIHSCQ